VAGGNNWIKALAVGNHTMTIKSDGRLWGFGHNGAGALGNGGSGFYSSPIQTSASGTYWKSLASSGGGASDHSAAIRNDGTLWVWGNNLFGQLGDNSNSIPKYTPVQTISGGANWKSVALGEFNTAAIKTDGTLWCWGVNFVGQLGRSDTTHRSSPVQTVAGGTNWKEVACTDDNVIGIKTDGTLWLWGSNGFGKLGTNNTIVAVSSPVQTVAGGTNWKKVVGGADHIAAIKTDGTLWTWGLNGDGQLGTNDTVNRSSPVQTVAGGTDWKSVSAGAGNSAAIKKDGTLWLWGHNTNGQLGTNDVTPRSSPVQTVAGGTSWKSVSVGEYHTVAINATWGTIT
jgi:alpha-tubulin suppressor-like RCC1 family protein